MQLHIAAKIHKVSEKTTKQFKILNKSFTANVWLFSVFHVTNKDGYGLPMIAVYLFGHRVGNIV